MTDEASVAPVDTGGATITDSQTSTHELGSQIPDDVKGKTPEPKTEAKDEAPKTNYDAVKRAIEASKAKAEAAVKAKEAEQAKPEAKPAVKAEVKQSPAPSPDDAKRAVQAKPEGDQTSEGRKPHHEPPARFLEPSKKDWASVPESVKEDVHRVIAENEKGIQKYKGDAEKFEKVREFDELARRNGREGVHESLKQLVEIEQAFTRDPIEGLKKVTDHFGINLQAVAAHIMGENPDQRVHEAHNQIRELQTKIQHMEMAAKAPDIVAEFAATHDRFEELSEVIATLLKTGTAKDLESAYELANVLKAPASNAAQTSQPLIPAESVPAQTLAPALNPAGSKSVSGAPAGGISPAAKKSVPSSNAEAVRRAMSRASA